MPAKPLSQEQKRDAARLKAAMERAKAENGLTQAAMAEACHWETQSTVSQYVSGKIPLNVEALARMCAVLNVPLREISPTLDEQARGILRVLGQLPPNQFKAAAPATQIGVQQSGVGRYDSEAWPFKSVEPARYGALSKEDKSLLEGVALGLVLKHEATRADKSHRNGS